MELLKNVLFVVIILILFAGASYLITGVGGYEVFILQLPEIISIVLAGIMITFILVLSNNEDLAERLAHLDADNDLKEHAFYKYILKIKKNFAFAFVSLLLSLIATMIPSTIIWKIDISLFLSLFSLIIFIGSTSNTIRNTFTLYEIKYLEKASKYKKGGNP